MSLYAHTPRQVLVDALLAPAADDPQDGRSLLTRRLEIARELLLRDLTQRMKAGPLLESPDAIREWLSLYFLGYERETFLALFLDTRHRLIHASELFQGTLDGTEVHPREVVREALRHNAASVCVAHNHPSGDATPSAADRALTAKLKQALALVDLRLLDHFVVAGNNIISLAARGWV
jgi:DNA repair protein RadC